MNNLVLSNKIKEYRDKIWLFEDDIIRKALKENNLEAIKYIREHVRSESNKNILRSALYYENNGDIIDYLLLEIDDISETIFYVIQNVKILKLKMLIDKAQNKINFNYRKPNNNYNILVSNVIENQDSRSGILISKKT